MLSDQSERTIVTLANAVEATTCIVKEILGTDVASTLNGSPLSTSVVQNLVLAEIKNAVTKQLGVN